MFCMGWYSDEPQYVEVAHIVFDSHPELPFLAMNLSVIIVRDVIFLLIH